MHILLVEDDGPLQKIVSSILKDEGYTIDLADDGSEGLLMARTGIYDLLIIDIMLPRLDGLSLIKELRKSGFYTPSLILTAKDSVEDKVNGLDVGADDYLVKPFDTQEFLARIRSVLRRAGKLGNEGKMEYGPVVLDIQEHRAFIGENDLKLTIKEYELFHYMIQNREQLLTREQIFDRIWGLESNTGDAIVDLYIHYLRKKLSAFKCDSIIRTIRGVGYMVKAEEQNV
jgi:two-component system response regulator CiaR